MATKKYYKASRNFWWNLDFLHLMAQRWHLPSHPTVLDVGAGQGHWARLLFRVLQPKRITCLDLDHDALVVARDLARSECHQITGVFAFVQASADAIPFASDTFDLVTCQTVLMHVPEPTAVLHEMVRVARPEGLIVSVEPNDLANCAVLSSFFFQQEPSTLVRHFEFWLAYGRGRKALGLGDANIGERLPELFVQAGLKDLAVYISDKTLSLLPPYDAEEQKVRLQEEVEALNRAGDIWQGIWDDSELRACVLAGGGNIDLFAAYAADVQGRLKFLGEQLTLRTYAKTGGRLLYVVSGIK